MTRITFRSRLILGVAATACLALGCASAAQAQGDGWYIGGNLPLMFIDDTDSTAGGSFRQTQMGPQGPVQQTVGYTATVATEHDTGYKLGGILGRSFDSGFRIEGEVFIANAEVSKLTHSSITVPALSFTLPGQLPIPVSGTADQLGAMVNVWYDFDTGGNWTPYVGGGLGFIRIDRGDLRYDTGAVAEAVANALAQAEAAQRGIPPELVPPIDLPEGTVPALSTTDTAFAYQIGAGIGYALSDSTTLQIGYRLQMVNGLSFTGENAVATVSSETDLRIHFLEIGIRYQF